LCTLLLTSCFDVIDEVTMHEDGSGEFLLTVNMSKSKTKLTSIMLLDSIKGFRVPSKEEINANINNWVEFLENSQGISNVKKTTDFNEFIFTLGFSFLSVENINQAIEKIVIKNKQSTESFNLRYEFNPIKKEFSRHYTPNNADKNRYDKLDQEDKTIFNEAVYVSIVRFNNEVANCTNKKAVISKSGKAVMIRTFASNIFAGNQNLSNTIQLK